MSDDETVPASVVDAVEGVMVLLQALVVALDRQGVLNTAEYARLLLDLRESLVDPDSIAQTLVDRMLGMLVDEPDVLVRRSALKLVDGAGPTGPTPDREP